MKAQTKALVASVVVIALALSAVSGITYSWFTDSEQSKIDISTAVVDYEVTWATSGSYREGTSWTIDNGNVTVAGLDASDAIPVVTKIENKSTIKTIYRIVATVALDEGHNYTLYDLKNIYIGGVQLNATGDVSGGITPGETVIADWTELNVGSDPSQQNIYITTPQSYGGGIGAQIVAYDPSTGEGSTSKDETHTKDWSQSTEKEGLSISLSIVAVQGDYPYSKMTTSEKVGTTGDNAVAAMIPENKVLKADSIQSSEGDQTVSNVIVDFSDVSTIDDNSTEISTENKVQVEVKSVNTDASTVTLDLTLWTVTQGQQTSAEQVQNPKFDNPVVITMTVPGKLSEPKITYNGEEDGKILSSTVNSNNTTTVVFSVDHFSEYVIADSLVTTEAGLRESLAAGGYVKLGADITMEEDEAFLLDRAGTVLDLNGHKIEGKVFCLISVEADAEVKNGELVSTEDSGDKQQQPRAIAINKDSTNVDFTLRDVDITGPSFSGYNRAITIGAEGAEINLRMIGGSISANHYPIYIIAGGQERSDVTCRIQNATIEGYGIEIYEGRASLEFENCTINAINQWNNGEGSTDNNFALFAITDGFNEQADGNGGSGSRIHCTNCEINMIEKGSAEERLVTFYTDARLVFEGCSFTKNGKGVTENEIGSLVGCFTGNEIQAYTVVTAEGVTITCWKSVGTVDGLTKAMNAGGYIQLTENITADVSVPAGVKMILDLNGKTLTASSSHAIENEGVLEIVDTSEERTGSVVCAVSGKNIVQNDYGGVLYIYGGNFTKTTNHYVVKNMGECYIIGGVFTASGKANSMIANGFDGLSEYTNQTDQSEYDGSYKAWMEIYGGTFTCNASTNAVLKNDEAAYMYIDGGKFTGNPNWILQSWDVVVIDDGNFELVNSKYGIFTTGAYNATNLSSEGRLTINGGTFKGDLSAAGSADIHYSSASVTITGGKYVDGQTQTEFKNLEKLPLGENCKLNFTKSDDGVWTGTWSGSSS